MFYSDDIAFGELVTERIDIVIIAVDDEIISHKAYLLDSTGIIVVIAVNETVDIHQSRRGIQNDIDYRNECKCDREKVGNDMSGLLPSVISGAHTGQYDKQYRNRQMDCQINNKIPHPLLFTPRMFLPV